MNSNNPLEVNFKVIFICAAAFILCEYLMLGYLIIKGSFLAFVISSLYMTMVMPLQVRSTHGLALLIKQKKLPPQEEQS